MGGEILTFAIVYAPHGLTKEETTGVWYQKRISVMPRVKHVTGIRCPFRAFVILRVYALSGGRLVLVWVTVSTHAIKYVGQNMNRERLCCQGNVSAASAPARGNCAMASHEP